MEQIMRNASSTFDIDSILPTDRTAYKNFLKGLTYSIDGATNTAPPSPAYMDARATIARGLVAALPDDAYSTTSQQKTINGQTKLNAKQAIFVITYLLELQFAVDKTQGLLNTKNGKLFPNIENFKSLYFTSDVGVAEIAAQMMAITGPSEGDTFTNAQDKLRSGELLVGTTAINGLAGMLLPEFKEFDASELNIPSYLTTEVTCSVEMFDGSTPNGLSVSLLQYDTDLKEFSTATQTDNTTTINFTTSDNQTFTASNVPTRRQYAIRFKIDSYSNEIPELFFPADEFSTQIDVCSPEGQIIGPDVEDKPLPETGISASSSTSGAEGLDFSNTQSLENFLKSLRK